MGKVISYNDILNCFNLEEWDLSYLTIDEINEVLNFPVKIGINLSDQKMNSKNGLDINENAIFLIFVKKTIDYDYSLNDKFLEICQKHSIVFQKEDFWCNYKYAAMLAGLGQYAKNSLLWHPRFHFDTHIGMFLIQYDKIIDLPLRNPPKKGIMEMCKNCDDCVKACPVSAINADENEFFWIDSNSCNAFCAYGNNDRIPSMKWNLLKIKHPEITNEIIKNIHNYQQMKEIFPFDNADPRVIINGQSYWIQLPVCRECACQKKCTNYNKNYPYDWNDVRFY